MVKKTILIVDDEEQLVDMLTMRLEEHGYEVISACDGEEGLQKAKQFQPDLIILDILMPKVEGNVVAEVLKKDKATASIPIIFLTCLAEGAAPDHKEYVSGGNFWFFRD